MPKLQAQKRKNWYVFMPNCYTKPPTLLHGYLPNIFSIWLSYQFTYYYLTKNFTFTCQKQINNTGISLKIQFINLYKYRFYLFLFFQPIFSSVYNIFSTDYSNIIFLSFHISITYVESSIFFGFLDIHFILWTWYKITKEVG